MTMCSKVPESDPFDNESDYYDNHPDNPKNKRDLINSLIYRAFVNGDLFQLEVLFKLGIDVNRIIDCSENETLLMKSVRDFKIPMILFLLGKGAKVGVPKSHHMGSMKEYIDQFVFPRIKRRLIFSAIIYET